MYMHIVKVPLDNDIKNIKNYNTFCNSLFKKVDLLYTTFIYTTFTIYSVLSGVFMYAIGVNGQGSIKSNKGEVQEFQFLSTAQ